MYRVPYSNCCIVTPSSPGSILTDSLIKGPSLYSHLGKKIRMIIKILILNFFSKKKVELEFGVTFKVTPGRYDGFRRKNLKQIFMHLYFDIF